MEVGGSEAQSSLLVGVPLGTTVPAVLCPLQGDHPIGALVGPGVGPHLHSLSFLRVLCPRRLRAAAVQQAVSGGWRQGCRRRRVALAGEPPRPGPGPPVRGFPHLSHLDGVRGALLRGRQRIQVSHWVGSGGPPHVHLGAGKALCLWVLPRWGGTRAGPGLQGSQTPQDGATNSQSSTVSASFLTTQSGRSAYVHVSQKRRFREVRTFAQGCSISKWQRWPRTQ